MMLVILYRDSETQLRSGAADCKQTGVDNPLTAAFSPVHGPDGRVSAISLSHRRMKHLVIPSWMEDWPWSQR